MTVGRLSTVLYATIRLAPCEVPRRPKGPRLPRRISLTGWQWRAGLLREFTLEGIMKSTRTGILALLVGAALSAPGCLLLNTIGLNPGHVSGAEAKDIIRDKTLVNLAIQVAAGSTTGAAIVYLDPVLAGISDDEYYKKSEVEKCGDQLLVFNFVSVLLAPFVACNLQPDNAFIDP